MPTNREAQALLEAAIIIEELANDRQTFQKEMRRLQNVIEHGVSKKDVTDAGKLNGDTQGEG